MSLTVSGVKFTATDQVKISLSPNYDHGFFRLVVKCTPIFTGPVGFASTAYS